MEWGTRGWKVGESEKLPRISAKTTPPHAFHGGLAGAPDRQHHHCTKLRNAHINFDLAVSKGTMDSLDQLAPWLGLC